ATKKASAAALAEAGARYGDVAIMSPVIPAALNAPLLISGPDAGEAESALAALGFADTRVVGDAIGRASAIKMIRSVMIKGVEALTAECLLAADAAGVVDEVLGSLGEDWPTRADYHLDRMLVHGARRAAEMEEVAKTLDGLGVEPQMARATVTRQARLAALGAPAADGLPAKLAAIRGSDGGKTS
ncbi:MAG: DUF1932 domain-containing protein, partial [Caulobacterales bacterium]|nr:DUF1932 domain-containing protein [Caulobacterales bacterium]